MARRTKLNPERTAAIVEAIQLGCTYELAAKYAGIDPATFYAWMSRGRQEEEGIYFEFHKTVQKAISKGAVANLAIIQRAAKEGSWQASAWIMERRHNYHARKDPEVIVQIDTKEASITQLIQQVRESEIELQELIDDPMIDLDE